MTGTGKMESSMASVRSSGLTAQCTKESGSTVESKEEVSSLERKAQYMKENGLLANTTE